MSVIPDQLVPRLLGQRKAIVGRQPLPAGLVTGQAVGVGHTCAQGVPDRRGQQGRFPWGLGAREPPRDASSLLGRSPAPDGMATDPEHTRHLTAGAGVLGLDQIEGLQAPVSLPIARGVEEPWQVLRGFVESRKGLFPGDRLRPGPHSPEADHQFLLFCPIAKGKWYKTCRGSGLQTMQTR